MSDFVIDFEWKDPLGANGPELRATWARLSIVVAGTPVTRVFDDRSRAMRNGVHLPLYPLSEWVAAQWWPLWNEPGPSPVERPGYEARHWLVSAREGYALPPLRIEPAGSVVKLSWSPERLPFHSLEFPGRGECWTDTRDVRGELGRLIDAVVDRLDSYGIADTPLNQDWATIQSADVDERIFCECAGALGLDPYSLDDDRKQEIVDAGNRLPAEIVSEFFGAARRSELTTDAEEIIEAVARTLSSTADLQSLKDLRRFAAEEDETARAAPWEQGYALARKLRAHLGLNGAPLNSMERIGTAFGMTEADLNSVLSSLSSVDSPFVALMGINDNPSPAFVLRPAAVPASRLFHFCRALFEYLHSTSHRTALISEANTEQQKRNRAFAAELLAPASALRSRVRTPIVTWEYTEELAAEFGVSAYIIKHQLANHGIAEVDEAY